MAAATGSCSPPAPSGHVIRRTRRRLPSCTPCSPSGPPCTPTSRTPYHARPTHALNSTTTSSSPFDLPPPLLQGIATVNRQWAQEALQQPLTEPDLDAQILLLGVTHFAPLQHEAVQAVLTGSAQAPVQAVALVVPGSVGVQDVLLPYPQVLQLLMELHDSAPPGPLAPSSPQVDQVMSDLRAPEMQIQSRLGKDIVDPYEVLGYYPALDYVMSPEQIAACMRLFGWLPGQEYATALAWATQQGAEVALVDASVRMQEAWVSGLVRDWSLKEADLGRQLGLELAALQQMVPPRHSQWDEGLAQALFAAGQAAAAGGVGSSSHSQLHMLSAFKASRACAAALLPPGRVSSGAVEGQARLQPLKFALYERQALHVATQLKELCRRRASAATLKRRASSSSSSSSDTAAGSSGGPDLDTSTPPPSTPASEGNQGTTTATTSTSRGVSPGDDAGAAAVQPFTVLAVVGRQYVPMIRRLWEDKSSALWRGDVPRTFAPSKLEPVIRPQGEVDPDTASGGSRPVGQRPLNLGGTGGGQGKGAKDAASVPGRAPQK